MRVLEAALVMFLAILVLVSVVCSPASENLLMGLQKNLARELLENLALSIDCMVWEVLDGGSITKRVWVPAEVKVQVFNHGNSTYILYTTLNETVTMFYPFCVRLTFNNLERGEYLLVATKVEGCVEVVIKRAS